MPLRDWRYKDIYMQQQKEPGYSSQALLYVSSEFRGRDSNPNLLIQSQLSYR